MPARLTLIKTVPVLRSFDEVKAREFYVDFLGFTVDWEHRFEPGIALHAGEPRGHRVSHLGTSRQRIARGAHVRVIIKGLRELHAELSAKKYKYNRPGLDQPKWGGTEMTMIDPASNCITFAEFDDA